MLITICVHKCNYVREIIVAGNGSSYVCLTCSVTNLFPINWVGHWQWHWHILCKMEKLPYIKWTLHPVVDTINKCQTQWTKCLLKSIKPNKVRVERRLSHNFYIMCYWWTIACTAFLHWCTESLQFCMICLFYCCTCPYHTTSNCALLKTL